MVVNFRQYRTRSPGEYGRNHWDLRTILIEALLSVVVVNAVWYDASTKPQGHTALKTCTHLSTIWNAVVAFLMEIRQDVPRVKNIVTDDILQNLSLVSDAPKLKGLPEPVKEFVVWRDVLLKRFLLSKGVIIKAQVGLHGINRQGAECVWTRYEVSDAYYTKDIDDELVNNFHYVARGYGEHKHYEKIPPGATFERETTFLNLKKLDIDCEKSFGFADLGHQYETELQIYKDTRKLMKKDLELRKALMMSKQQDDMRHNEREHQKTKDDGKVCDSEDEANEVNESALGTKHERVDPDIQNDDEPMAVDVSEEAQNWVNGPQYQEDKKKIDKKIKRLSRKLESNEDTVLQNYNTIATLASRISSLERERENDRATIRDLQTKLQDCEDTCKDVENRLMEVNDLIVGGLDSFLKTQCVDDIPDITKPADESNHNDGSEDGDHGNDKTAKRRRTSSHDSKSSSDSQYLANVPESQDLSFVPTTPSPQL